MENNLSCAIVRDLLPSYVDGLTSDETAKAVESHIADCQECANALRLMKEPEPSRPNAAGEVDYLKKVRRKSVYRSLIIGLSLLLISLTVLAYRFFYVGYQADASEVLFDISVDGNDMKLTARLASSGLGVSRITFSDSNGMVQVMVYTAPKMFFNHGDFTASYSTPVEIGRVQTGEIILWENGQKIDSLAARLFAAGNPFVGDMSANSRIAEILKISEQMGTFTNELQTGQEPYGWTVVLDNPIPSADEGELRDAMIVDSCAMLASIDNLGYVTWRYRSDNNETQEFTFTADEASKFSGHDVKRCCDSVVELQALLRALNIK